MNPQMNKVFSKLAKEEKKELKSEKINLISQADLKKVLKILKDIDQKTDKYIKQAEELYENSAREYTAIYDEKNLRMKKLKEDSIKKMKIIYDENREFNKGINEVDTILNTFVMKARDLGFDASDSKSFQISICFLICYCRNQCGINTTR